MEVSWLCLRAGVTGHLWFYGRNMRVLGAEMDQEAGTAPIPMIWVPAVLSPLSTTIRLFQILLRRLSLLF